MMTVRYWALGGVAVLLSAVSAPAQVYQQGYEPAPGYPAGYVPPPPQVQGFNRVIVTDAPMPPDLGRPYPYTGGAQPGVLVMPPHPGYLPPRYRGRKSIAYKNTRQNAWHGASDRRSRRAATSVQAPSRALIAELRQKRSRIKQIAVEDATGSIPAASPRHRAVPAGHGKDVRVIRAEAEVKIIGNDQMSIRLYRKRGAAQADAD